MILAINIDNSLIELGIFKGDDLILKQVLGINIHQSSFEYALLLKDIISAEKIEISSIKNAILSSVVPKLEKTFIEAVNILIGTKPLVVGKGVKTGLDVKLAGATGVGTDFVCNCVGCLAYGKLPAMVADVGYVTTISVIDKNGAFVGRTIHCGGELGLHALGENTALLPTLTMSSSNKLLGRSTEESITLGALFSSIATITYMKEKLCNEFKDITVFITGSESEYVKDHLGFDYILDTNLALKGLSAILKKNT